MGNDILTVRDVATYLKVTEKTVYGLAQQRRIPAFKVGGQWRFRRDDIETWIGVQTEATTGVASSAFVERRSSQRRPTRRTGPR